MINLIKKINKQNAPVILSCIVLFNLSFGAFIYNFAHDPYATDIIQRLSPPGNGFIFGTDEVGFDIFSRTIIAGKIDLFISLSGTLVALLVGLPLGLMASDKTKNADRIMKVLDMFQAFPLLVLAIVIVAMWGNNIRNVIFAIILINIPRFTRLIRSEALTVRESRFIEVATAMGASKTRIISRHLLPNILGTLLAQASITTAHSIVVVAALSFIGIGVVPPEASWGSMIRAGSQYMMTGQWWMSIFPGLAIFISVLSFNTISQYILRKYEQI
jgi:peptide/nickel transport system permease protein|tara:strand:+ start:351 stop:1169 length:819 start_codon:yes stop_codon:yes gene_type:complete